MKKALLILCFTLLLSACANQSNDINSSNGDKPSTTSVSASELDNVPTVNDKIPFDNKGKGDSSSKIPQVKQKLSDEEISKLSTQKCGFGQGLRLDNNNRPYGSLDFNSVFEKYDSYAIVEQSDKVVYLTFDQGYENGYTSVILDTLKEKNVKATFFVLTDYVKRNPELVKRMIDEGHTVGNHSVHHYSMPTLDINTAKKEILDLHDYMKNEYNYTMYLFRPPMGEYSEQSLAITQACGYKTVFWSYAYADWDTKKQMDPALALEKVKKAAHPGCIYLLHSVSSTNAEILGDLIDELKSEGYTFSIPQ
jgi:peptidoglycan-N-acetylmuramic acid deacetylase